MKVLEQHGDEFHSSDEDESSDEEGDFNTTTAARAAARPWRRLRLRFRFLAVSRIGL